MVSLSDEQLLQGLVSGGIAEHHSLKYLYQTCRGRILQYVRSNQGSDSEANDIFQEGVLILYKQIRKGKFRGESSISTYLYGICRYLWLNQLKEVKKQRQLEADIEKQPMKEPIDPYRSVYKEERRQQMFQLLEQLKHQCKEVLVYAIFDELPMDQVAQKMGFENAQVARNKKYKCLKRLKQILERNPGLAARLQEWNHP